MGRIHYLTSIEKCIRPIILSNSLKKALDMKQIVDREALQALDAIVSAEEVELFLSKDWVS